MNGRRDVAFPVLLSICFCHAINDMLQSLLASAYPALKTQFHLTFAQIGLISLAYQLTASLLQPLLGLLADRRPMPFSLPVGTLFTFAGLLILGFAPTFHMLVVGACVLGVGSSVFHPESSRVARMASGGRPGLAQSLFQVGGNLGSALGPAGAAMIVLRQGQSGLATFAGVALVSTAVLTGVGFWYRRHGLARLDNHPRTSRPRMSSVGSKKVVTSLAVLLVLIFSKFVYLTSLTNYYTFYLMHRFGASFESAQIHLLVFLLAAAVGTLAGGPLGDRFGRKRIIWFSILGALPFTLALPHVDLAWTGVLSVVIGFTLASAFPAIVVFGQELIPGRVGMVSGLFFGLSFGVAGSGAAVLGKIADMTSIEYVYALCSFLPALGIVAGFLPELRGKPTNALGAASGAHPAVVGAESAKT